jgi:cystathionine beta-lyase/cystathionine gamma-synthase
MSDSLEDICPRPDFLPALETRPLAPAIYPAAVYECHDPQQAASLLAGDEHGYVYSRDGHPNADLLGEKCRELHGADRAIICGSGMSAMAVAALAVLRHGDHVVVSNQLYGRNSLLFTTEIERFGVRSSVVDVCDLAAVRAACSSATKLIVVETITNPLLRVADLAVLAEVAHAHGAKLLVDNTFAGPLVCRPLALGADLVVESLTKIMNGHSDVLLGLLCGRNDAWERVPLAHSTWGHSASPFDCWLAARGLGTLALRVERATANALAAAQFLTGRRELEAIYYPGLSDHPDHRLAARQFGDRFGTVVTFTLRGGLAAGEAFIHSARRIPFCPSLGDLSTTLSHPESTSHRTMPVAARQGLGIFGGTIRLSVGIESREAIISALTEALAGVPHSD